MNIEDLVDSVDGSFAKSGADDLRNFLLRHAQADRVIIASDYNVNSPGSIFDVYSFSIFPNDLGLDHIRNVIREDFPRDFKQTFAITRSQSRFHRRDLCFSFVFLIDRTTRILRTGDYATDLLMFREMLDGVVELLGRSPENIAYLKRMRSLRSEIGKKNVNLYLVERIFVLAALNSFVTVQASANMPLDRIMWLFDEDDMTTYSHSIFDAIAHLNYSHLWYVKTGHNRYPKIDYVDRRDKINLQRELVDEMIRIPDFFSAVLSRWHIDRGRIVPPEGTKRPAARRYISIMRHWLDENDNLWLGHCRSNGDFIQTGRILMASSRNRLRKLQALKSRFVAE